ncbi:DUF6276 family protein [Halobacteria archaeon AArc-dxtr1]|nr:DUF6276 family protein [Halobacteria archaeon AArc-dxtr1]
MACSRCERPTVAFAVPEKYREYAPETTAIATICSQCLAVSAGGENRDVSGDVAAFDPISDAYPTDPDAGVVLSLLLDQCDSLATNRAAIETLLLDLERRGVDPLLTIDRLLADSDVEPAIDLDRRRHQLEQLLY